ncbi:hypothetical protein PHLGIDRAFT_120168 [Phlebiopsis gigantea 11061_1 CR5-6]|uniref:BD-FAE-like domain-containing protein n=1 Tax=Phlebiopsis gigantea (strain 11061_1 CR5-6) TaxID=745531 RepID=A0A0C3S4K3_PHLG1|nr:hypothetical protein PHLGIDRAFT_120168 [Phlebiopsis gigantea 11061_1 CR5-6]
MDVVAQYKDAGILSQIEPTLNAFYPLLEQRASDIDRVQTRTFKYGSTERHQLDIYYPPSTTTGTAPILFFVYGGGYLAGDKRFPAPHSLLWGNVGAFFAERGYVTIIADYRLLPAIKFPDPVIDIKDAVAWVVAHEEDINDESSVHVDIDNIFLMGHSAGAAILATFLLLPDFVPPLVKPRIRGVVLQAGMHHLQTKVLDVPSASLAYYGSQDSIRDNAPLGLLLRAQEETISGLPDIITAISQYEAPGLLEAHGAFLEALRERTKRDIGVIVMNGHHHISPHMALYTGVGEEWACKCDAWMKERLKSVTGIRV